MKRILSILVLLITLTCVRAAQVSDIQLNFASNYLYSLIGGQVSSVQASNIARFFATNSAIVTSNALRTQLLSGDSATSNALFALWQQITNVGSGLVWNGQLVATNTGGGAGTNGGTISQVSTGLVVVSLNPTNIVFTNSDDILLNGAAVGVSAKIQATLASTTGSGAVVKSNAAVMTAAILQASTFSNGTINASTINTSTFNRGIFNGPYIQSTQTNAAYAGGANGDFLQVSLAASSGSTFSNNLVNVSGAQFRSAWEQTATSFEYDFGLNAVFYGDGSMLPLMSYSNLEARFRYYQPLDIAATLYDDVPLRLRANSTQTSNLLEFINWDGSPFNLAISSAGAILTPQIPLIGLPNSANAIVANNDVGFGLANARTNKSLTGASGIVVHHTANSIVVSNTALVNGEFNFQTNLTSATTQQIDYAYGPADYFWTKISTNMVFQFTNLWIAGISNRTINFYVGGSDDGNNYTVTFVCPNPGGVTFKYGLNSLTNGATTVTVTNARAWAASATPWKSNLVEVYHSHL